MARDNTTVRAAELHHKLMQQFRRPMFRDSDKTFLWILLGCFIVQGFIAGMLSLREIPEISEREIARNQERYVQFIGIDVRQSETNELITATGEMGNAIPGEADTPEESAETGESQGGDGSEGGGSGSPSTREMSTANRQAARMANAGAMREAIAREVSDKGLLRLLTGTGSAVGEGRAVNPFTEGDGAGITGDLDPLLASSSGLKTQGESGFGGGEGNGDGLGVRGGRSGSSTGIDDMIQGFDGASSQSLTRKGELKIETTADIEGRGRASIYRSAQAIHEVILSHQSAIQHCYERELKRFPDMKGKVTVSITIGPDGAVKEAAILESTINNERVERCILSRIRRWKDFRPIDAAAGDVKVAQSFLFGY